MRMVLRPYKDINGHGQDASGGTKGLGNAASSQRFLSNPGETQKNAMDTLTSQNDLPPHSVICCGKIW